MRRASFVASGRTVARRERRADEVDVDQAHDAPDAHGDLRDAEVLVVPAHAQDDAERLVAGGDCQPPLDPHVRHFERLEERPAGVGRRVEGGHRAQQAARLGRGSQQPDLARGGREVALAAGPRRGELELAVVEAEALALGEVAGAGERRAAREVAGEERHACEVRPAGRAACRSSRSAAPARALPAIAPASTLRIRSASARARSSA